MTRLALAILAMAGCAGPQERTPAELRVGIAAVEITPPTGHRMAGYFHERLATGVKDPLFAKAIVFEQGGTKAALIFCDLIGVPNSVTAPAREQASRATGIPATNIGVAATHSHTGPLYSGSIEKILRERHGNPSSYGETLVGKIAEAVAKAHADLRPSTLEAAVARPDPQISYNRRFHMKDGTVRFNPGQQNPDIVRAAGPINPDADIIVVRDPAVRAVLTVFALHLDTVGGTEYSADFPRFLEEELRRKFGARVHSLFGAGTCGDINHIDVTVKGRPKTREIGERLAAAVIPAVEKRAAPETARLALRSEMVEAPLQKFASERVEQARKDAEKVGGKEMTFLKQVETCAILHLQDLPPVLPLEVQALRLSRDVAIVTLPGEVFVDFGLAIKKASPFKTTLVVELANDNPAYVPTKKAFAEGSYETVNSRVQPGGGEMLAEAAIRLLRGLAE